MGNSGSSGDGSISKLHEAVPGGVRLNLQTVEEGSLKRAAPTDEEQRSHIGEFLDKFYGDGQEEDMYRSGSPKHAKVLADSITGEGTLFFGSFVSMCLTAYDQHLSIALRADDFFSLFVYAFAQHVNKNAEALRSKFVSHEGKKVLLVKLPGDFIPHVTKSKARWEKEVFPQFSGQIKAFVGDEWHKCLVAPFSTSTPSDIATFEVSMMSAFKSYFAYYMTTRCGIPSVTLLGTLQDWTDLYDRSRYLFADIMPDYWKLLSPVLEEFISSYKGQVDPTFWERMCKKVQHGKGSGSFVTVSGWISLLFPYLKGNRLEPGTVKSPHLKSWKKMESKDGPRPEDFPACVSSCPVLWDELHIDFHAGIFGFTVNEERKCLQLRNDWIVSEQPPEVPVARYLKLSRMLADVQKGEMVPDAGAMQYIRQLEAEMAELEKKMEELKK